MTLNLLRAHINDGFVIVNRAVQPLLALMFGGTFCYMTIIGREPSQAFTAVTTAVILWWFKSEDNDKAEKRSQEQQAELVDLAKRLPPTGDNS